MWEPFKPDGGEDVWKRSKSGWDQMQLLLAAWLFGASFDLFRQGGGLRLIQLAALFNHL
jgi:hypothetical protein